MKATAHKKGIVPMMLTVQMQLLENKKLGWLNPNWSEWFMGYPENWTKVE